MLKLYETRNFLLKLTEKKNEWSQTYSISRIGSEIGIEYLIWQRRCC